LTNQKRVQGDKKKLRLDAVSRERRDSAATGRRVGMGVGPGT
jgi:hypothetical protein